MRKGSLTAAVLESARAQAALTRPELAAPPAAESPATPPPAPAVAAEPPAPRPTRTRKPVTTTGGAAPTVAGIDVQRVQDAIAAPPDTRYGVAVPAARQVEETGMLCFRAPRHLMNALRIRAVTLGVTVQELGLYSIAQTLANLEQAAPSTSSEG